ncbi:hypothetical protein Ocin01_11586 [Orchesella cincta]|uniref:Uncharacterized protein n=1 Tax=Orchesella cincta TaxID=48709 RepID=A0A1D2MQC6_ORCCI|nr:hypothetical protein Ocin01_11586 [Orchesella cincta]
MSAHFESYIQRQQALFNLAVQQTDEACPVLEDDDLKRIQSGQQSLRASKVSLANYGTFRGESCQVSTYGDRKQEEEQLREIEASIKILRENAHQDTDGKPKVLQRKPWTISKPENESQPETVVESTWNTFEIGESDQLSNDDDIFDQSPKLLVALAVAGFFVLCLICVGFRNSEMICTQLDKVLELSFRPYYVFRCLWETRLLKEYFSPEQFISNPGDSAPDSTYISDELM